MQHRADEIEEADFEEVEVGAAVARRRGGGVGRRAVQMVYAPAIRPRADGRVVVMAQAEDPKVTPWGFWGGWVVLAVSLMLVASARSIYSLWDMAWALVALAAGLLLWRYGRRNNLAPVGLVEVDGERGQLTWLTGPGSGRGGVSVGFEEVTEVVFGMTTYPISGIDSTTVEAFSLLVRDGRDELVPIIEATPHKDAAYRVARFIGAQVGEGITYVGRGVK